MTRFSATSRRVVGAVLAANAIACLAAPEATAGAPASAVSLDAVSAPGGLPTDRSYRFSRGDEVNVKFFFAPELNTVAMVRPDGRVSIPLVGEIVVEGRTTTELATEIVAALDGRVKRPDVSINLQGGSSQRVFVGGEVARPGVQPLTSALSVLQAVMVAEGIKDTADTRSVAVIRRGPHGERQVLRVDLQAALDGRDATQDLALQAADVVVIPRSGIANVNLWVDQYLRRNLPIGVSLSYSLGPAAVNR